MSIIKIERVPVFDGYRFEELYTGEKFDNELEVRRQAAEARRRADYLDRVADHIREGSE